MPSAAQIRARVPRSRRTPAIAVATLSLVVLAGAAYGRGRAAAGTPSPARPVQAHAVTPATAEARTSAATASLRGRIVLVDPGHNPGNGAHPAEIARLVPAGGFRKACDTTGTAAPDGYTEAAFTLDVAHRLTRLLRARGARVVLTHDAGTPAWGPCVNERAAIGNRAGADVAISIHADGSGAGNRGFHVIRPALRRGFTDGIVGPSARLARIVRSRFAAATGLPPSNYVGHDGIDVRADLGGLNLSHVPKVFVESGNMRNSADRACLESPACRQREAQGLADALATYLQG